MKPGDGSCGHIYTLPQVDRPSPGNYFYQLKPGHALGTEWLKPDGRDLLLNNALINVCRPTLYGVFRRFRNLNAVWRASERAACGRCAADHVTVSMLTESLAAISL